MDEERLDVCETEQIDADEDELYKDDSAYELDKTNRIIISEPTDPTIETLYENYRSGDLVINPDFQRKYVWEGSPKPSNLIESILLQIPIPTIFTSEEGDKEEVIDGQQRLTSIFSFIDGKFPSNKPFKLGKLRIMEELKGKTFKDLDKSDQKKIMKRSLRVIRIKSNSEENVKFEMFERLNTNITKLNAQELRNCMYRGAYNDFIKSMAKLSDFKYIVDKPNYEKRLLDEELVLLFLAFNNKNYIHFKGNMKQFINDDMKKNRNISKDDLEELETQFKKSVSLIKTIFGKEAFRVYSIDPKTKKGSFEQKKLNQGLYLILMYGFTPYSKNQIMPYIDLIKEELLNLQIHDAAFIDSLTGSGTNSKDKVILKFEKWLDTLKGIMGYPKDEPRCFSYKLKQELWDQEENRTCPICNGRINTVTDSEIDHITCYWRGGKTIPENARLVHRICNRLRGGDK